MNRILQKMKLFEKLIQLNILILLYKYEVSKLFHSLDNI